MFKQTVIGLTCFLAGIITAIGITSQAQSLRLELSAGISKHALAPEGTWWYSGFDTNAKLVTPGYTAGLLWTPIKKGDWLLGARVGYADLGRVRATNSFPVYEDGTHRDARVNPSCNRTTLEGCTGKFDGSGKTKGWYLGPAFERDFGGGVALGGEIGVYRYRSAWVAGNVRIEDGNGGEFIPPAFDGFTWNSANGEHTTSYVGANARWNYLYVYARRYSMVHASQVEVSHDFIGMTSGPVWTVMVGLSIPL